MIERVREALKAVDAHAEAKLSNLECKLEFTMNGHFYSIIIGADEPLVFVPPNKNKYEISGSIEEAIQKQLNKHNKKIENGAKHTEKAEELKKLLDALVEHYKKEEIIRFNLCSKPPLTRSQDYPQAAVWWLRGQFDKGGGSDILVTITHNKMTNQFKMSGARTHLKIKHISPTGFLEKFMQAIPGAIKIVADPNFMAPPQTDESPSEGA